MINETPGVVTFHGEINNDSSLPNGMTVTSATERRSTEGAAQAAAQAAEHQTRNRNLARNCGFLFAKGIEDVKAAKPGPLLQHVIWAVREFDAHQLASRALGQEIDPEVAQGASGLVSFIEQRRAAGTLPAPHNPRQAKEVKDALTSLGIDTSTWPELGQYAQNSADDFLRMVADANQVRETNVDARELLATVLAAAPYFATHQNHANGKIYTDVGHGRDDLKNIVAEMRASGALAKVQMTSDEVEMTNAGFATLGIPALDR